MHLLCLDRNVLIDLATRSGPVAEIRRLVDLQDVGRVQLAIPAVSGSENQIGGRLLKNFSAFRNFVRELGLEKSRILPAPLVLGYAFLDYAILTSEPISELRRKVEEVFFPKGIKHLRSSEDANSPRRNKECDVLSLVTCIIHKCDAFVTSDKNFHRRKVELRQLGAPQILTITEAADLPTS